MRAVTYHRVSTLDQNPELARDELRKGATQRGFDIVAELEETGSGAKNNRPELLRLLEMARRGQVEVVLVWKLDRFGRSAFDLLGNIRALEDAGVRFIAVSQGIDVKPGGDPISRLLLTMLAGVAEFERELIRERVRLGLQVRKRRGIKLGPSFKPTDDARIKALRSEGKSWAEISEAVGCTVATARRRAAA